MSYYYKPNYFTMLFMLGGFTLGVIEILSKVNEYIISLSVGICFIISFFAFRKETRMSITAGEDRL